MKTEPKTIDFPMDADAPKQAVSVREAVGQLDLIGKRFGRLTVIGLPERIKGRTFVPCRCDCGKESQVMKENLVGGRTKSCGCFRSENSAQHCQRMAKHGESGKKSSPEYRSWRSMRKRCLDPNNRRYLDYGGRGIMICDSWLLSFDRFLQDMGRKPSLRHSLERKDNDGHYCPDNCIWALPVDQANNRRSNRNITSDGVTLTITQWARRTGLPENAIRNRLRLGWAPDQAVTRQIWR